ncbi:SDR family oxidoreductase [Variovorax defluvii]|uniref:SDR family oxidoreductase n=1 Tax=Variovorax defluvii TaxID=913761 RepID=A0ABP8HK64_9BURK
MSTDTSSLAEGATLTPHLEFQGRIALVVGGGSGIGAAVACQLAAMGSEVVVMDRSRASAEERVRCIRDSGGAGTAITADITDLPQMQEALQAVSARHGGIDLAVNAAGVAAKRAQLHECSAEDWDRVVGVNLTGLFNCLKVQIPLMLARNRPAIVNIASIAGLVGMAGSGSYCASKHGVIGLTKACALDYGRSIRVNAVAPGFIATPLLGSVVPADGGLEKLAPLQPMKRIGTVTEVADLITFLLSSRASFITGSVFSCDGGFVAQ